MTDPFSYYMPDSPHALGNLRRALERERLQCTDQLALSEDWPDFKERLGKVYGLVAAIRILDEIAKQDRN